MIFSQSWTCSVKVASRFVSIKIVINVNHLCLFYIFQLFASFSRFAVACLQRTALHNASDFHNPSTRFLGASQAQRLTKTSVLAEGNFSDYHFLF
jgi:hypothetical protein